MCTYVTETHPVSGSAKGPDGWFRVTDASVYFDHPVHAPEAHTLNIDFLAPGQGPSARVAVELTAESARALARAIEAVLEQVPPGLVLCAAWSEGAALVRAHPWYRDFHPISLGVPAMSSDAIIAESIRINGHGGDEVEGYCARPLDPGRQVGGVVVIHHMPGFDIQTKEIARRFAAEGYNAVVPNLYWREAPGASPDDAAATARAAGGVPDERLVGDVAGACAYLKALPTANGKVGTIGYCSGGRQSFLAAVSLPLDAAVDCYGAFIVGSPPEGSPLKIGPLVDRAPELSCPLLGLFGAEDAYPSPEHVKELEEALKAAGKAYEFHTYENAGHAFFAVNRPAYRPEAANDGWQKILAFYGTYLSA